MTSEFRPAYGFARKRGVTVAGRDGQGRTRLVVREPIDVAAVQEVRRRLDGPVQIERQSKADFDRLITGLYEADDTSARHAAEDLGEELDLARLAEDLPEPADLLESEDDAPIIRLINGVLTQAIREGASDIHLEPFEERLSIRFRVDGVLREVMAPARGLAGLIVSRIKVMARLDIAEKRVPQDGRIGLRIAGRPVDVRVSTLPSNHGERVVLRLLDKQAGRLDLAELGMDEATRDRMESLIQRPHGILLVTGPTGSGKSTTLYAALMRLNDRSRNIMTVEDPIEYDLDGVGQTQVNPKVDLTFARGLRAILRQDPDVVMVGEIRDLETARIAVQASLTGHLVLSTLHTNTAVGAIARLVDMGVEPFLLASSLIGVLAQRLVRVLDPATREAYTIDVAELERLGVNAGEPVTLYRPGDDLPADQSGYHGRTGIYELVPVNEAMRKLIHDGASEQALDDLARELSPSIFADGWRKALAGKTSLEEVLRVTRTA
ncbi:MULTISPECIES: type II secretion system ATPase GspE [unclassified Wenzhouxiangella]|uniref:type II secretion system ATPase GspE n=1 Tax=unclassified Wenzhouxiangella TaxID=2613841 RepID=UPI000E327CB4|nr:MULTISPECIES: type II secretion system ATPase GspE [unclassified Wenzhouxiangella]RFF28789.1 type II secretion system protein GspE [Wenzhouxiangella sp. 15181]RFP67807.1 type II secretion system protein GspE [Wenzhouxiangella sp. 15190]